MNAEPASANNSLYATAEREANLNSLSPPAARALFRLQFIAREKQARYRKHMRLCALRYREELKNYGRSELSDGLLMDARTWRDMAASIHWAMLPPPG
jgi:hypothetical protein